MLDRIEKFAELSVGRACGFACIAISCFMLGFSPNPPLALKTGGLLTLLTAAVLAIKARNAPARPYKHTELWVMLPRDIRPPDNIAQQLIGGILADVYLRFARHAAVLACLLLASALLTALLGLGTQW